MNEKFMKSKKYIVIAVFLVISVLSFVMMKNVAINYNISDYLNEDTETKISLEIIDREFGAASNVQVMVEDVDVGTANAIKQTIKNIPNVLSVNFDQNDENYYKDGDALFVALVDGDEYSSAATTVLRDVKAALDGTYAGRIHYGGAVVEKANLRAAIVSEIPMILVISVCLAAAFMLLTSKSWLEPFILLGTSGIAILINMGTNIIFGEISYITNAVCAILQLALSVDYSIVLIHSYRAQKEISDNNYSAMKKAIREVISPVSASALTTIAGLLALLFMSFRIGFDIGIVLMKGILVSAITSMTLLPALLLLLDKLMCKTAKKDLIVKGTSFSKLALKSGKVVIPIALALVIVCGALQFGNSYTFTDSKNSNQAINNTFGQNNAIVVVYPNADDNHEKEAQLAIKLGEYKTSDGKLVLKNYTAYSNTVRELYDVKTATKKLNMPEKDVVMLLTMYHLYNDPNRLTMTTGELLASVRTLLASDPDLAQYADENLIKALELLPLLSDILDTKRTANELYDFVTGEIGMEHELALLAVKQVYGTYLYDSIPDRKLTMLDILGFLKKVSTDDRLQEYVPAEASEGIAAAIEGINTFNSAYDSLPMILKRQFEDLHTKINARYEYDELIPTIQQVIDELSALVQQFPIVEVEIPDVDLDIPPELVQQVYILYFNDKGLIPDEAISGREILDFVKEICPTYEFIDDETKAMIGYAIEDVYALDAALKNEKSYSYVEMAEYLNGLIKNVKSAEVAFELDAVLVSGVYIKHAINNDLGLDDGVAAIDLLNFVEANMETNMLLSAKMDETAHEKVEKAKGEIKRGTELLIGENYSRMLLSIDLPSEGEESAPFVEYLTASVKEIFGNDAHVGGEIVSTHDLNVAFDRDNTFISVFTIVSIFVIIMIIFRSISLPVLLVTIIQGAIWICMATSLITGPMFFMSYIMATCILMGATIDYGILMSTNYVRARESLDKKEALYKAVAAAMPTVFTSGIILTVCGFVVGFIASQNSISSVGWLLGKGTLVSMIMITVVLPATLYMLDGFVLKLTLKNKPADVAKEANKDE